MPFARRIMNQAHTLAPLILVATFLLLPAWKSQAQTIAVENRTLNIWTQNVAGWTLHRASATNGMVEAIGSSIRNRDADFIALNELCFQQYKALQSYLRDRGWPQVDTNFSRFESSRSDVCKGQEFGNAIFSREPLGPAGRYTLPDDGQHEKRNLLCASSETNQKLRFCTVHITTKNHLIDGEPANVRQLNYTLKKMDDFYAQGMSTIIAGDFNAQPNYGRMNNWYSTNLDVPNNPNNTGHHRELDDTDSRCVGYGEQTIETPETPGPCGFNKIDMIFVREELITGNYSADALAISMSCGGPCSDHRIVTGQVTIKFS